MKSSQSATATTAFVSLLCLHQRCVSAGMPSITLSDVGRLRLSTVSFFLVLILLSAVGIRFLWNVVRRDFPKLPRLSYRGAITGVLLWGLVFVIVLTMISGARELMTPGAWVKSGQTYRAADHPQLTESDRISAEVKRQLDERTERIAQLQVLGTALREFASQHDGAWPTAEEFRQLPQELRTLPGDLGTEYLYRAKVEDGGESGTAQTSNTVIVLEPAVFGDSQQLALYRSGVVGPFRRNP